MKNSTIIKILINYIYLENLFLLLCYIDPFLSCTNGIIYIVYIVSGEETKLAINSKYASSKFSSCELAVNGFLVIFICILILEIVFSYLFKRYSDMRHQSRDLYLGPGSTFPQPISAVLQDMFSFLLLYYYIIPMSLYVTIELYKFIGELFYYFYDLLIRTVI